MTHAKPSEGSDTFEKIVQGRKNSKYHKNYIAIHVVRRLFHTTKVELLREVKDFMFEIYDDDLEATVMGLYEDNIDTIASRHGITEEEINQKEV